MSDYAYERAQRLYYERYLANVTPPTIAVNVSITSGSTDCLRQSFITNRIKMLKS